MTDTHSTGDQHQHGAHDIWVHMPPEKRLELKAEDSAAWHNVVGLLIFIVSVGITLAVLTVILSG
jgi:hypothetical protein